MKKFGAVAICAAFLCGSAFAQDAKTVIANAQKAMGDLKSITYSGAAKDVAFQQCGISSADLVCRGTHDPMRPITNYVRVIDLTAPTSRHTGGTNNPAGGGATTPAPGTFFQQVTPQQADLAQPWAGSLEFYITPWGFLRGAAASPNTFASRRRVDGKNYVVLSWNPAVKAPSGNNYLVNGYVNEQNIVDRVETWLGDNIMGDMHIVATYTGWKDFGGVMAPSKIVQTRGGWPFFEVDVTAAKANPPDLATLAPQPAGGGRGGGGGAPAAGGAPAGGPPRGGQGAPAGAPAAGAPGAAAAGAPAGGPPRGGQGAAPAGPAAAAGAPAAGGGQRGGGAAALTVQQPPEKLGEGVFRFTTGPGSYDSLLIEFRDHLMLLEAGQNEARALAYIAEAKKMFPNKPIRYVMNTHPHADHTGGLPAMVAEGATIITHRNNEEFFERALNTPRTLLTDTLAKSPKKAKVESVGDKKVYTDGSRIVEFYHAFPAPHSNGLLIAYLPKEKVLFQGDFSLPAAGQPANDHIKALVPILEKLNLDFDRYINVHTSATPQTKAELWKAVGK
ncbi:MAG TPA: MBL fold metallo-hydrolase [Terriglobia bacterium]|nr:MBL fold metallo-hydrolase [Terriglobia bacterium]